MSVRLALALALATQSPGPPSAAHHVDALHRLATRAYLEGRFEEAVAYYLEVDALAPSAPTSFNVGLAALRAGEDALAYTYLERCLKRSSAEDRELPAARALMARVAPKLSLIEVTTEPPGASVAIEDWGLGTWGRTPLTLPFPPGVPRTILLRREGFAEARVKVETRSGRQAVRRRLERLTGRLTVSAVPSDAAIVAVGTTTVTVRAGVTVEVPTGTYRLVARRDGFQPETLVVEVGEGGHERRTVALRRIPPPRGRLVVVSRPQAADVFLDGRAVAVTPALLELDVGAYLVRVARGGETLLSKEITIDDDASVVLDVGEE